MTERVGSLLSVELDGLEALSHARGAFAVGDHALAERYFLRALRISDDFYKATARTRYLEYLLDTGRLERALSLAEGWIRDEQGIDLYSFLMRLIAQDPRNLSRHFRRLRLERHVHPWSVMNLSQELSQAGRAKVAISMLKRLIRWCEVTKEREDGWRAMGQLGRVYEDAGMHERAEAVWSEAFNAGSSNRILARRYTHYLERKGRFDECLRVVDEAMTRIRDRAVVEILERRRERLLRKKIVTNSVSKLLPSNA